MAGPSFSTPRSVVPSVSKKRFSLSQANKALPLVKRIVGDIVRAHGKAVDLQGKSEDTRDSKAQSVVQKDLAGTMDRLADYVQELTDVGVELKDYETGLIDFIGQHQGRDVYLCWKLGEEKIAFWHELNGGYSGRKPVSMLEER